MVRRHVRVMLKSCRVVRRHVLRMMLKSCRVVRRHVRVMLKSCRVVCRHVRVMLKVVPRGTLSRARVVEVASEACRHVCLMWKSSRAGWYAVTCA